METMKGCLSFWDKTGGLNSASLQIRSRKLLLMQKALLFFTLKYITYNKECRGCIILNSRYFSRKQDSELVAINFHMRVNALYKTFSSCLLRPLTAASTEMDKKVALSFLLKNFKFNYVGCFYSFTCSLRKLIYFELSINDTSNRWFYGDKSNLCISKCIFKWKNR